MRGVQLFPIWVGCAAANFLVQAFGDGHWSVALDRSFFQATAMLAVYICAQINARLTA